MRDVLRVLVADPHDAVRRGVCEELETRGNSVLAEVGTVAEAVKAAVQLCPDVAVLGVRFADGSGIEACRQIVKRRPATRVVIFTEMDREAYLVAAQKAGAVGLLDKATPLAEVARAVEQAATGTPLWTAEQRRRVREWHTTVGDALASLTPREREVLQLLTEGKSNAEIAAELGITGNTVERHVTGVLGKLGVKKRQEALAWAQQVGALEALQLMDAVKSQ